MNLTKTGCFQFGVSMGFMLSLMILYKTFNAPFIYWIILLNLFTLELLVLNIFYKEKK